MVSVCNLFTLIQTMQAY